MSAIEKYLAQYAEQDCQLLANFPDDLLFEHCIALPVYNETIESVVHIEGRPFAANTLLIVVLNQSEDEQRQDITESNLAFCWLLKKNAHTLWQSAHLSLLSFGKLTILLAERHQAALCLKTKEGVGRARKLAGDLALTLFRRNVIQDHWLYSTDADAQLPDNYFTKPSDLDSAAMVFDFQHQHAGDDEVFQATQRYEQSIKYFRDALFWAGSPYAYCSLGSALAIEFEAYAQARGFPPRAAAEDFYLLNKIAKIGKVHAVPEICIQIKARLSDRIPFGTGPAVQNILELQAAEQEYCYYQPNIFKVLKTLLTNLDVFYLYLTQGQRFNFNEEIEGALNNIKLDRFRDHCIKQKITAADFAVHFHTWFDAFQTLKFIHYLRDHYYPDQPLASCLNQFDTLSTSDNNKSDNQ